jgi:hypothetical protein
MIRRDQEELERLREEWKIEEELPQPSLVRHQTMPLKQRDRKKGTKFGDTLRQTLNFDTHSTVGSFDNMVPVVYNVHEHSQDVILYKAG